MRGFVVILVGQLLSLTGSAMTTFGLTVWLWQETGQATSVALHAFLAFAPGILISPLAGVVADRFSRKLVLVASDVGAGLGTVVILLLVVSGRLEVWHLYAVAAWSGAVGAFQVPALAAAVSTLVPKAQLTRANGMRSLAGTASSMLAPAFAGVLLSQVGLVSILLVDLFTLCCALLALAFVQVPFHGRASSEEKVAIRDEVSAGFRFLARHRGLLDLSLAFTALQFFGMMTVTLLAPMILARTAGDEAAYGAVAAAIGAGGVLGAGLMTVLRPPRRFALVVAGGIVAGSAGLLVIGVSRSLVGWVLGGMVGFVFFPRVGAASAALKQRKTPPEVQGRVFAADQLLQTAGIAGGILLAGPLADLVFEPAFSRSVGWAGTLIPIVGRGSGSGMAALMVLAAVGGMLTGLAALASKRVRTLEDSMLDADSTQSEPESEPETSSDGVV